MSYYKILHVLSTEVVHVGKVTARQYEFPASSFPEKRSVGGEGRGAGAKKIRMWGRGSKGKALGTRITVRMDPSPTLLGSSVNDFECFGRETKTVN